MVKKFTSESKAQAEADKARKSKEEKGYNLFLP